MLSSTTVPSISGPPSCSGSRTPQCHSLPSFSLQGNCSPSLRCLRAPVWHLCPRRATQGRLNLAVQALPFDLPFDQAWAPSVDVVSLAPQFFAASLFPYLAFLYFLHSSGKTPPLTLFGFYFLLAFVGATIPAGIYAKVHYGTSLANVDWLHGTAESLLTITNLLIVLGLRKAIREVNQGNQDQSAGENVETPPSQR